MEKKTVEKSVCVKYQQLDIIIRFSDAYFFIFTH